MIIKRQTIHIICGPTAGGKSARALALAQECGGVIINCDSVQIYEALPILSAQPGAEDLERAAHRLYGCLHPNDVCSAGNWREMALPLIREVLSQGRVPIICGGTGLYIRALTQGLSPMPDIPEDVRARVVARYEQEGPEAFYADLKARDPAMAARFHVNHKARLIRAMEVLESTGKSLAAWQNLPREAPPEEWDFAIETIIPERGELYRRCNARFEEMLACGALEEVAAFAERIESGAVKPGTPATKALGFAPLRAYLEGKISREEALERAQADTRHYAKRQTTWFKNQI